MLNGLIPVQIKCLLPAENGIAVFLGNDDKVFSIHVDHGVGMSLALLIRGEKRERPLTHDLIGLIFSAFNITVERIVINDLRDDTYFARLTLRAANEVHRKITEIDARPSDCLAISLVCGKPVYVAENVWNQVTDLTEFLVKMKEKAEKLAMGGVKSEDEDEEDDEDEKKKKRP